MSQYKQPNEKLFKVWDIDKEEWWIPIPKSIYNQKRLNTVWSRAHNAEQTMSNSKNPPKNYKIVEFRLVDIETLVNMEKECIFAAIRRQLE